jgi:putative acetyltransferase
MELSVRPYEASDAEATAALFHDTVRTAAGPGYSAAQRKAWSPEVPDTASWHPRLAGATTMIAEDGTGLAGFMSLRADGYLDMAFVRADRVGTGVAKALYDSLLAQAEHSGIKRLTTDASHLARRFFERQGWHVVREQRQTRGDVELTNFRMERTLG